MSIRLKTWKNPGKSITSQDPTAQSNSTATELSHLNIPSGGGGGGACVSKNLQTLSIFNFLF